MGADDPPGPHPVLGHEGWGIICPMCRNIVRLRRPDRAARDEEIRHAALQFVRKVSGYREPSRANREVFARAVEEISASTRRLLAQLVVRA